MKASRFDLRNLRSRDVAIICVVLTALALLAWYFYMFRPTQQEARDLEGQVTTLTAQVTRGEAARRNLPELREQTAQLELERELFLAQLPRESEVAALLDQLRTSATSSGVIIESLGQSNVSEPVEEVRPLGFSLATTGTFGQTMSFLNALEELQRFTKVRQVGLSVPSDGSGDDPSLDSDFDFTVYVFTGDDPGTD